MASTPLLARARANPLPFIFATVLIDTIGFGIVIPVLPSLIVELTAKPVNEAAAIGGWLAFTYAVMQFLCGPVIGNLSDRFGRRPVLLVSLVAFAIDYALMGLAPSLFWLFVGRVIAGITGASYSTAYAYIADVSPPEKRAQNFGLVGMGFGLGFIIGPALGGLIGEWGHRAPFFVAGALALVNAIYGWFVLPESLPLERRRPFSLVRANPVGSLLALRRTGRVVVMLAAVTFVWLLAGQSYNSIWAFYTEYRYGWSEAEVGLSLAAVGLSAALVQGLLGRVLIPRWGEAKAVRIGMVTGLAGFLCVGAAASPWLVYAGIAVGALNGLAYPSLNALMSRRVPETQQGELQGAVASLFSLTTIVGPPIMAQMFVHLSGSEAPLELPGAPFFLSAVLAAAALLLFARVTRKTAADGAAGED